MAPEQCYTYTYSETITVMCCRTREWPFGVHGCRVHLPAGGVAPPCMPPSRCACGQSIGAAHANTCSVLLQRW